MSDSTSDGWESLLTGRHLRILRQGDSRLLIRSAGRWFVSLLLAVLVGLLCLLVLLSWLIVWMAAFPPADRPSDRWMIILGIPCALLFPAMLLGMIYVLLKTLLPRQTMIDLAMGTIVSRHLPGFADRLRVDDVATVDLVMFTDEGKGTCILGCTHAVTGYLHPLHWLGGYRSAINYRDELRPAGELLARFLGKPLDSSTGRMGVTRMWKGHDAERIVAA